MENLRDDKFIEKLSERTEWQPLFLDQKGKEIPFSQTFGVARKKGRSNTSTSNPASAGMASPMGMPTMPYPYVGFGMPGYPYPGAMSYGMSPAQLAAMRKAYGGAF